MAISPGLTISSGRVFISAGLAKNPDFINQGIGFMNSGALAINTSAVSVAAAQFVNGFAVAPIGSLYGTTTLDRGGAGTDTYHSGLRRDVNGALVYAVAAPTDYSNGNPVTATGALACI
jgi:hypothetical protein